MQITSSLALNPILNRMRTGSQAKPLKELQVQLAMQFNNYFYALFGSMPELEPLTNRFTAKCRTKLPDNLILKLKAPFY